MRRSGWRAPVGTLLLAVCALWPAAARAGGLPANVPVTRPELRSDQEPSLAVDPRDPDRIAVAYREGNSRQVCGLAQSRDGGRTWTTDELLGPRGRLAWPPGFSLCYEAVVAYGADGTLYDAVQAMSSFQDPYSHILITSSADGVGFRSPHLVDPATPPRQDRGGGDWFPRLSASPDGPAVYVRWTRYTARNRSAAALVASSSDHGVSFSPPAAASPPAPAGAVTVDSYGAALASGRSGAVYASWLDLSQRTVRCSLFRAGSSPGCSLPVPLVVTASHDGGRSFGAPVTVDPSVNFGCPGPGQATGPALCDTLHFDRGPEAFSLAAGAASGTAYLAWWTGDPPGRGRLWFSTTRDGGRSWAPGRVIGIPPGQDADQQHRPQLSVAPDGRLDVTYYSVNPEGSQDVYWVHSEDGGAHFSTPELLTDHPSDINVGPVSEDGTHSGFGEWLGAVSTDSGLRAAWTDMRRGTVDNAKQDVYFASADLGGGGPPWGLIAGAVGAAAAAAAAAAALAVRRRRPTKPAVAAGVAGGD